MTREFGGPSAEEIGLEANSGESQEFMDSEAKRKERLKQGLPPMGELNENINHAEYLMQSGDRDGKRLFEAALQKKRDYFSKKPQSDYRPPTQTKPQRERS